MSSNAFARSRPRTRHQRVPKTPSYAHPRFLKLVKELARIDEAKKKLLEPCSVPSGDTTAPRDNVKLAGGENSTIAHGHDDCSSSNNSSSAQQIIAQLNQPRHSHHHSHHHHHHHHHHNHSSRHQQQAPQHLHQQADIICCPGLSALNYSSCVNEANTSNGYRSLEFNQSASALHDNYYRQNNSDNQEQVGSQVHHPSYQSHHQRHYSYPSTQQESFSQSNSGVHHSHHADYRGLSKCPSSSSSTNASLGYSKPCTVQQTNPQVITCTDSDLRQDENCSKRKRSANETPSGVKKSSPTSTSPPASSKRHKSSPEPPRPLSPSFTKCPICLLDCMDRDPSFTNTCFHLFCFVCIENWSKSKATCPLCRTKFSKIIYNIRSESCFEEKIASPLRRDDDDDRFTYEQLSAHSMIHPRTSHSEEARLLFDNIRNNDVLMPHLVFTNQIDPRQVDLHSFNSISNNANFNSTVPHATFASANYNPGGSNYIALIPSNGRLQTNSTGSAITSAYPPNTSLTTIGGDSSNRAPRVSRSGRYIYSRNYDLASIDGSVRGSRSTNVNLNPPGISLDLRPHHHPITNTNQHHQHHNHHSSQQQHRSTIATIELGPARQSHHPNIHLPYPIPPRHYTNPNVYARRPYTNPPIDQHILDELYTQIPEI